MEAAEHFSCRSQVKRYVMEDCHDTLFAEIGDEAASCLQIFEFQVEHVGVVFGIVRGKRQFDSTALGKWSKLFVILIPDLHTAVLDGLAGFQLSPQICGV